MKRGEVEEVIADMLLLYGAHLKSGQNKGKDAERIEEMYNNLVPKEIRILVSENTRELYDIFVPKRIRDLIIENRDSFNNAKKIRIHLSNRWSKLYGGLAGQINFMGGFKVLGKGG